MDAIGMSHIAICVRDMDKSLGFYRDILGMEVTFDGPTDPTEGGRPQNPQARQLEFRRGCPHSFSHTDQPSRRRT